MNLDPTVCFPVPADGDLWRRATGGETRGMVDGE